MIITLLLDLWIVDEMGIRQTGNQTYWESDNNRPNVSKTNWRLDQLAINLQGY